VPVSTGFTYQGYLDNSGSAASGVHDFTLALYDAEAGGVQIGSTVNLNAVLVQNGLFTVELDFGVVAFGQNARLFAPWKTPLCPWSAAKTWLTPGPQKLLPTSNRRKFNMF
jgi:hypothetical protein